MTVNHDVVGSSPTAGVIDSCEAIFLPFWSGLSTSGKIALLQIKVKTILRNQKISRFVECFKKRLRESPFSYNKEKGDDMKQQLFLI